MSKSKVDQVVGDKIVPVTGPVVVLPADAPSNEATIVGLDFGLRKMDRMHKDAIAARSKKHPLDASLQAFMLGADGKVVAESGFLFYGQPHYAGGVGELARGGTVLEVPLDHALAARRRAAGGAAHRAHLQRA